MNTHSNRPAVLSLANAIGPQSIHHAFELSLVHGSTSANPDKIRVVFHDALVHTLAKVLAGLESMDLICGEVTFPLADGLALFEGEDVWAREDRDAGEGDFEPSSVWLKVQSHNLAIEIWDKHGDDELHGSVAIKDIPGLQQALVDRKVTVALGA